DEATLLERQERAGPAAGALREDQERVALAQRLAGLRDRRQPLFGVAALERDEAPEVEGVHQDWQLAQLRLVDNPQTRKEPAQRLVEDRRVDGGGGGARADG